MPLIFFKRRIAVFIERPSAQGAVEILDRQAGGDDRRAVLAAGAANRLQRHFARFITVDRIRLRQAFESLFVGIDEFLGRLVLRDEIRRRILKRLRRDSAKRDKAAIVQVLGPRPIR